MSATFETPSSASINRVQIIDLPGLPLDEDGARAARRRADLQPCADVAGSAVRRHALGLDTADLPPVLPHLTRSKAQRAP